MFKNSKVKVRTFNDGTLIKKSADGNYCRFPIEQEVIILRNGFLNSQKRVAFISGRCETIESLNIKEGDTLPGAIVEKRSFQPFYEGQQPIMTNNGEPVLFNGALQYRQYEYHPELDHNDHKVNMVEWVENTNVEVE